MSEKAVGQKPSADSSSHNVGFMVVIWLAVFAVSVLICGTVDIFVLHPIPQLENLYRGEYVYTIYDDASWLELAQTVYPDAALLGDETSTNKILYIETGGELHLLYFDESVLFCRWALKDDVVVPENYTGTIRFGTTLNKISAEFEDGVLTDSRSPNMMSRNVVISMYFVISLLPATVALLPTWLILKRKKKSI